MMYSSLAREAAKPLNKGPNLLRVVLTLCKHQEFFCDFVLMIINSWFGTKPMVSFALPVIYSISVICKVPQILKRDETMGLILL